MATMTILDRAGQIVDELNTVDGLVATMDPANVSANLPCVLVPPPRVTFGHLAGGPSEVVWRLLLLGPGLASLAAWVALDEMLGLVEAELPIESAEPGTYAVAGDQLVAAYVATWTDDPATWPPLLDT